MYRRTADPLTEEVLGEVRNERRRQERLHGDQSRLPDGTGPDMQMLLGLAEHSSLPFEGTNNHFAAVLAKRRCRAASDSGTITFEHILTEEFLEAVAESDPGLLYEELVQVAAVAVQWCEKLRKEGSV